MEWNIRTKFEYWAEFYRTFKFKIMLNRRQELQEIGSNT